ncbi:MAG: SSS family solute:Na+ symporter [Candidatus Omnitrophota bacterium]|jgi:SSS family solute:Na+ symporter
MPLIIFSLYLMCLIYLAVLGQKSKVSNTPKDFYLANSSLGVLVLFATIFASLYSGNTMIAFPAKAYRMGYAYTMCVTFMVVMISVQLLYAPALRRISQKHNFITPSDWILHRYKDMRLTLVVAAVFTFALLNYLLAQLIAVGHAFSGLTGGQIPYAFGVFFLAIIIVLYETIGGMRAVAWTDILQGLLMIFGITLLGFYILSLRTELHALPIEILAVDPLKVYPPDGHTIRLWVSTVIIMGIGGALFPQGIQRIYAAKSILNLKKALLVLLFTPFIMTFFAYLIGLFGIPLFPGLEGFESDEIMSLVMRELSKDGFIIEFGVAILMVGILAAMMSTADSILLSLSSILVLDFYAKTNKTKVSEEKLLHMGKVASWVVIAILAFIALNSHITLWRLIEIKIEYSIQIAPAFILGLYWKQLSAKPALQGIIIGIAITTLGLLSSTGKWWGIHPGLVGLIINLAICYWGTTKQSLSQKVITKNT